MSGGPTHIAVFGPGLMGASLLMALRLRHPEAELSCWARRKEAVREVLERGLAGRASTDAAEIARNAETLVLCVPVDRIGEVGASIAPHVGTDTLVTDVGSTKRKIVAAMERIFAPHGNFVGSHPMCGSEESGLEAARPNLYEGALCVVCPTASTRAEFVARTEKLWESVGGRIARLSPDEHDAAAATASHVPHLVAAALVELVAEEPKEFRQLCATGFRDTTRIASGSPTLWSAILEDNAEKTSAALQKLEKILAGYRESLCGGNIRNIESRLAAASTNRGNIFPGT